MQAMFVAAFGGAHNYVRIHDPSDTIESWTNNTGTSRDGPSATSNRTPQESHQIPVEQLGINITTAE